MLQALGTEPHPSCCPSLCDSVLLSLQTSELTDCAGAGAVHPLHSCVGTGASFSKGLLVVGFIFPIFFVELVKLSGRCDI